MSAVVSLGDRAIGDGQPCFIIAEAGSNHNGRLELAKQLIDTAASAGADAVKFQLFRAERMYSRRAGTSEYLKMPQPIYDIIAQMEMPYDWLPQLAAQCERVGISFLASVFDEESADRLNPFVTAHKIASYEMTHLPLVRHVAAMGKSLIISTGTANLEEVSETVEAVRQAGNPAVALMQCTAAYPAPVESLNVRAVTTLKARFGVPVGLSDHSRNPLVGPLAAVALGANLIEKHITLDNDLPGPDHGFAIEPDELRLMVRSIREIEQALGTGHKEPHPVEAELRQFGRRSIFAVSEIAPGECFTSDNTAVLRCGKLPPGLPPKAYPQLLGRAAVRQIAPQRAIQPEDVS